MPRHEGARTFAAAGLRLRPEWMVLRPQEAARMAEEATGFDDDYEVVKVFDATPRLRDYADIPGGEYLLGDAVFRIYKRKDRAP